MKKICSGWKMLLEILKERFLNITIQIFFNKLLKTSYEKVIV
jgi:hypothetical protein